MIRFGYGARAQIKDSERVSLISGLLYAATMHFMFISNAAKILIRAWVGLGLLLGFGMGWVVG